MLVANWNQSRRIREFVAAVEKALAEAKEADAKDSRSFRLALGRTHMPIFIDPIHVTFAIDREKNSSA